MKLLVATHNQGKVKGISEMLADAGIACLSLDDVNVTYDVEETGATFLENATLKAVQYAQMTGLLTLADDSGLEVAALDNAPGIYTARYGGSDLAQPERNQYLLTNLAASDSENRAAQFRCVLVLAAGNGDIVTSTEGVCRGSIAHAPSGSNGFGYDPLFMPENSNKTMAEIVSAEKHKISHRGQALRLMIPQIQAMVSKN